MCLEVFLACLSRVAVGNVAYATRRYLAPLPHLTSHVHVECTREMLTSLFLADNMMRVEHMHMPILDNMHMDSMHMDSMHIDNHFANQPLPRAMMSPGIGVLLSLSLAAGMWCDTSHANDASRLACGATQVTHCTHDVLHTSLAKRVAAARAACNPTTLKTRNE